MCGIAAAFAYADQTKLADREYLKRMCDRMSCRGPDGHGTWSAPGGRVALGHRRLAIIDLSDRGAQPMASPDGTTVISFNGEIYNFRELRTKLERSGRKFLSDSDTEVLLHLYEMKGSEMIADLRGMFAFALWDERRQRLLLARDPFGIKPLYYLDDGHLCLAASEVKALLRAATKTPTPDPAGHVGFYVWGHIPEPYTLYKEIRALPAGSFAWVTARGVEVPQRYNDVRTMLAAAEETVLESGTPTPHGASETVSAAVADSVKHHLIADVDVGVFLSSGIDSTTLVALAAEAGAKLKTVTLGFQELRGTDHDEVPLAEAVARHYGAEHQTVWISRSDFQRELPRILDRMDQPSIDGINSYFVAKAAADVGLKVALSGLGGDELFGGYPSFRQIPRLVSATRRVPAARLLGRGLRALTAPLLGRFTSPKYASVLEYGNDFAGAYLLRRSLYLPSELSNIIDADVLQAGWSELNTLERLRSTISGLTSERLMISGLEAFWYMRNQLLRDTDWASMSHSVEVRVPLVDASLWRSVLPIVATLPNGGKQALAQSPQLPLPTAILSRPKTGFVVPTRNWLIEEQGEPFAQRGLRGWAQYVHRDLAAA